MTDDRAPFREARDAGLAKRHEQRLAHAREAQTTLRGICKCGFPADDPRRDPGWDHFKDCLNREDERP